jgi:hypothetical protein
MLGAMMSHKRSPEHVHYHSIGEERGVYDKHMTGNQICGLNKNPCVVEFGSSLASAHCL